MGKKILGERKKREREMDRSMDKADKGKEGGVRKEGGNA